MHKQSYLPPLIWAVFNQINFNFSSDRDPEVVRPLRRNGDLNIYGLAVGSEVDDVDYCRFISTKCSKKHAAAIREEIDILQQAPWIIPGQLA